MKRLFTIFTTLSIAMAMSGVASAQRGHGGGRPATTGIENAETKANTHSERGIENAEAKHSAHKRDNDRGKGRGHDRSRGKSRRHDQRKDKKHDRS